MDRNKSTDPSGQWSIVTLHPWLPSKSEQIARSRAWGVDEDTLGRHDISALFLDDVRDVGRTTNWWPHLVNRADFMRRMAEIKAAGDHVFFATPLCVGWSAKLARDTLQGCWDAGLLVYVHAVKDNGAALYAPGDDVTELLDSIASAANARHQSKFRRKS